MGFAIACDDIFFAFAAFRQENISTNEKFFPNVLSVCLSWKTYMLEWHVQSILQFFFFLRIRVLFSRESNKKWVKNNFLVHITCFISFLYFAAFCKNKKTHLTNERVMKNKQEIFYFAVLLEMWNSLKLSIVRLLI